MKPRFLCDVNFDRRIVNGLRRREPALDIVTHEWAGLDGVQDDEILRIAARAGRVLLTQDPDFQGEARALIELGGTCGGVILVRQGTAIGRVIDQLIRIWMESEADAWVNVAHWLRR